ncbi:hypothetical protein EST92_30650 [Streptomyces sp. TM32]|nr:hypothetical protein EST92_30650 [Streptomyces sp. TM32]
MSVLDQDARQGAFDFTSHFREDLYACLTRRGDTLFELVDALLCENGPVTSPVDLTLLAEHRRGHGALYDALNCGRIDAAGLRRALAVLPQPKAADNRLILAVDVTNWLRPDAPCSPERLFCHVYDARVAPVTSSFPAGRTRSWPRWRPAAPRGANCWTRSASVLDVEDQVGDVLLDARHSGELVQDAVDSDAGDSSAGDRRQERAAQGVTQGVAEARLQRLDHEPRAKPVNNPFGQRRTLSHQHRGAASVRPPAM